MWGSRIRVPYTPPSFAKATDGKPALLSVDFFLLAKNKRSETERAKDALHSFSDGGQSRQENRKGSTDMFYTYIIRSINHPSQRYIGSTSDLRKRLAKHNEGGVPHTAPFKPWKLEVYIAFETKAKATAFEAYLKTGSGHAFANRHF